MKETAQTAADAVRQQAARFAEDVGHELSSTGEAQKTRSVEAIRSFARAIDSAASELESQPPSVARTFHETARRVDSLSEQLANRNVNELLDSAAQFARTRPALFIGGAAAAGFALPRFLMSSARQRVRLRPRITLGPLLPVTPLRMNPLCASPSSRIGAKSRTRRMLGQ